MVNSFQLGVSATKWKHSVSPMLFGAFLEDINFSCDGGLNANLVSNASFDGAYLSRKGYGMWRSIIFKPDPHTVVDRLRFWVAKGLALESHHEDPVAENSWYARVRVGQQGQLENLGFNGVGRHRHDCAMSIRQGQGYEFFCWIRGRFEGNVSVDVEDNKGQLLTTQSNLTLGTTWKEIQVRIEGQKTGLGKLVLKFQGQGTVDLDGLRLLSTDTWKAGDLRWSQGRLRRDLVEALRDLKPRFLRFPGGCIVEGNGPGNEYNWKDTIGPIVNRKGKYNLWAAMVRDGGYCQSYEVGFYEYFLLCEDLGMEPVPTLFAGLNCQARSHHHVVTDDPSFRDTVIQSYLDLIDYANGDPATNAWAAKRAEAGHPQPFGLKYIGVGNENYGPDYAAKFALIKRAIDSHSPGIVCVMSSGTSPQGREFDQTWRNVREYYPDVRVDEHCYAPPRWFIDAYSRYDHYPREGAKVYMGEYAANFPMNLPFLSVKPNIFATALAEAVFLAGLERNSDIVAMSSYAPLFSLVDGQQWAHNLINFSPAQVLRTANYYVQWLFGSTVGTQVLAVEGAMPEGVFVSATSDSERVVVKLINTGRNSLSCNLLLEGANAKRAQVIELQSDDLKAANRLGYSGDPEITVQPVQHEVAVKDGRLVVSMKQQGIYVVTAGR
jgi:alpha-L-arabinofuranosidase